jgi:hypothetical protein
MKTTTPVEVPDQQAGNVQTHIPMSSWAEWKERCAAALCADETRHQLETFVTAHFNRRVQAYTHRSTSDGRIASIPAIECMHRLESSMVINRNGQGKAYKDWLFARAANGQALEALESGVVLLIRDVVREYLRREHSPSFMISLNDSLTSDPHGLTIEDLIPCDTDPSEEASLRELEQLASWHAQQWDEELDHRERIALLAREMGLSLAHPEVEHAAGCRKSVLNDAHQKMCERVVSDLRNKYQNEDGHALKILTIRTLTALAALIKTQAAHDPACKSLLLMEGS